MRRNTIVFLAIPLGLPLAAFLSPTPDLLTILGIWLAFDVAILIGWCLI